jgi:hypothetical protein
VGAAARKFPLMPLDIEILIPLRNPTEVLAQTIKSLVGQTERNFSVLISENHSTEGLDHVKGAEAMLLGAGIEYRLVRPPRACGRVEHWNWAHSQSGADWLKPLFVGDWLEPQATARWRDTIAAYPQARFIHFGYQYHGRDDSPITNVDHCVPRFRPPAEMNDYVLRFSQQFGPPTAVLLAREAIAAAGGFRPMLPICADSLFFCELAIQFGAVGIPEVLSHFQLHGTRFSTSLPGRPAAVLREKLTYQTMLVYHAWNERRSIPWGGVLRLFAREIRNYFRESAQIRHTNA